MSYLSHGLTNFRPQFEDSAVAVIITKQEKLQKYERMVAGQELLESRYLTQMSVLQIH